MGGTLVIIDGLDALLRDAAAAEEVKKALATRASQPMDGLSS